MLPMIGHALKLRQMGGAMPQTEIGQRYTKVGVPMQIWEVELERDIDFKRVRHFLLRNMEDPSRTILVSEKALLNPRLFQPAQEMPEPDLSPRASVLVPSPYR